MKPERARDYVILLDDLNFQVSKSELKHITNLHNDGMDFEDIAKETNRDPYEVVLALLHQAKIGANIKPIAYRVQRPKQIAKYDRLNAAVEVKKMKKGKPTVIEIDGHRYVHEPETKRR